MKYFKYALPPLVIGILVIPLLVIAATTVTPDSGTTLAGGAITVSFADVAGDGRIYLFPPPTTEHDTNWSNWDGDATPHCGFVLESEFTETGKTMQDLFSLVHNAESVCSDNTLPGTWWVVHTDTASNSLWDGYTLSAGGSVIIAGMGF